MKKYKYQILTIIWMLYIFYMSHQDGTISSNQSGSIVEMLLNIFPIPNTIYDTVEVFVRKTAHVAEYAILTYLIFKSISAKVYYNPYLITALISVLYASSDEFHQYFIPGRSGQLIDVGVDSVGIALMLVCLYLWNKKKTVPKN